MTRTLGLFLAVVGGAVAVTCIVLALRELSGLYSSTMNDPLGQPATAEKDTSHTMLTYAAVGAAGAVPMVVGVAMVRRSRRGR